MAHRQSFNNFFNKFLEMNILTNTCNFEMNIGKICENFYFWEEGRGAVEFVLLNWLSFFNVIFEILWSNISNKVQIWFWVWKNLISRLSIDTFYTSKHFNTFFLSKFRSFSCFWWELVFYVKNTIENQKTKKWVHPKLLKGK